MSDKPSTKYGQLVSKYASSVEVVDEKSVESVSDVRRNDANWKKYEFKDGTVGWKNAETGEIHIDDVSPNTNEKADWSEETGPRGATRWVSEDGRVRYRPPPGFSEDTTEEQEPTDELNDPVTVDRSDVEQGDYIGIDGEKEGYIDAVERSGDDVFVRFEDGDGLWIEEDMSVAIDEDPPPRVAGSIDRQRYIEDLYSDVDISERSTASSLDRAEVAGVIADNFTRTKKDDIASNTVDAIETIEEHDITSSWYGESNRMRISKDAYERVVCHETAHATAYGNGFDTSDFAAVMGIAFSRQDGINQSMFGRTKDDIIRELESSGKISPGLAVNARDAFDIYDVVRYDDLTFSQRDDYDDNLDDDFSNLISAIDDAFVETVEQIQEDGTESVNKLKGGYELTNSNELFAAIHENLQQDGINRRNIEEIYYQYPEVLSAYFEVFEPNDLQKRELNQLFKESGGSGPIESEPFPEAQ